jgi:Flp pilus assembly secretin CpaC/tetratricopeptide (TPR) repeat protein
VKRERRSAGESRLCRALRFWTAALLLTVFPNAGLAQAAAVQAAPGQSTQPTESPAAVASTDQAAKDEKPEKQPRSSDRRRAVKLFLEASKLFEKQQFEAALDDYQEAAELDPGNRDYPLAAELARSHAMTALMQTATQARIRGDAHAERAALNRALVLDPRNIQVTEHLYEMGDDALRGQQPPLYEEASNGVGDVVALEPSGGLHSFHLHTDQKTAIQQVFKAFGVQATVDDSVHFSQVRLDLDGASFEQAARILGLVTDSFYVPLDAHRVLVARDTADNRKQFERLEMETIYLPGLTTTQINDVGTLAKTVFELPQSQVEPSAGTITVRGALQTLNAFNATVRQLIDGRSQVVLDVELIELAHTSARNTGIQPPQSVTAVNVYAEEQSLLNANQALVQQIISSGLAAPGDTLAILGILLASGQISSSLLSSGAALFGGGITASALSPGSFTANFSLNSSKSKNLEHMQLRLGDGEDGTVRSGTRYPIQTSSYSGLSSGLSSIAGLTGAGTSSNLSSLLGGLGSSVPTIPQVQYQDLGLTLKATPSVMRNSDVALKMDLKIDALSGSSVNGNPILDSRAYQGVVTLKQGEGVVVVSELDEQQTRAISGLPGLSEIPGLNNVSNNNLNKSGSTLVVVLTPHVVRGTQAAGHSPMMRVERTAAH